MQGQETEGGGAPWVTATSQEKKDTKKISFGTLGAGFAVHEPNSTSFSTQLPIPHLPSLTKGCLELSSLGSMYSERAQFGGSVGRKLGLVCTRPGAQSPALEKPGMVLHGQNCST